MRFVEYIRNHVKLSAWVGIGLFVLACGIYAPSLKVGFLSDDWHAVWVAQQTDTIVSFFGTNIVGDRIGGTYGPVFNLFMYLQYHLFHLNAVGYHMMSIMLFAGTAWIIFKFVLQLFQRVMVGAVAAWLFLCIPSHVEAVTWIAGQPHVIATFFYVLALYWYAIFSSEKKIGYYFLSLVSIAASLLTKEIGITFILACVGIDWWYGHFRASKELTVIVKNFLRVGKWYGGIVCILGLYILLRKHATGIVFGYYGETSLDISLVDSVVMGLKMTVGMVWSYPWRDVIVKGVVENTILLYAIGSAVVIGGVWAIYRRARMAILVCALYVFSLIPYVSLEYNAVSNEGERYTYLPSVFFAIGLSGALYFLYKRYAIHKALYMVGIGVLSIVLLSSIVSKNAEWVRAGIVVKETLPTMQALDLNPLRPVVFVGIPDRLAGAQAFRNGTFLALEMLGYGRFEGDRILASPLLDRAYEAREPVVRTEYCGDTTDVVCLYAGSVSGEQRIFTGLPVSEVYGVRATLEGFRRDDHRGEAIRLEKKNSEVQIVYFNYGAFQLLDG